MTKKISRRDAIKLLGAAAGATLLANLPSKWKTPELTSGVLPAHAQTSCVALFVEILSLTGTASFQILQIQGPLPDVTTGNGGAGSTAAVYCQPGCFQAEWRLLQGTGTAQIRVTTLTDQVVLNFDTNDLNNTVHGFVVNLATGAIGVDGAPADGICVWMGG